MLIPRWEGGGGGGGEWRGTNISFLRDEFIKYVYFIHPPPLHLVSPLDLSLSHQFKRKKKCLVLTRVASLSHPQRNKKGKTQTNEL
jgi:hypothetical protein